MTGNQWHFAIGQFRIARGGSFEDFRLLPGIAGGNLPIVADAALEAQFDALAALFAGEDGYGWVAGVGPD